MAAPDAADRPEWLKGPLNRKAADEGALEANLLVEGALQPDGGADRGRLDAAVARCRVAVRDMLADLRPGELVLVACSGGVDSLAVAAATAFEAPRAGMRVGGITVDHGLQEGSAERAGQVAGTLKQLGLDPVEITTVHVSGRGGPEAAARTARYAALGDAAARLGAAAVLLGHTLDDQAETVLLGLARGSGARSLAGMPPVSADGRYRRPFLDIRRETTQAACVASGLTPWDDPHNADTAFTRVRIRSEALPALVRSLGPGVPEALARTARRLREDADALDEWARTALERAHSAASERGGGLDVVVLAEVPAAVRGRVLREYAIDTGCPPGDLFAVHIDALDALVTRWHGQRHIDLPGGVTARRMSGRLVLSSDG